MWWERLIGASWNDGPTVQADVEICDYLLLVLQRILTSGSLSCTLSALHGLNEIGPSCSNPTESTRIIRTFLQSRATLSPRVRAYALDVISGNAL